MRRRLNAGFILALEIKLDLDVVRIAQKNLPTRAIWHLVHMIQHSHFGEMPFRCLLPSRYIVMVKHTNGHFHKASPNTHPWTMVTSFPWRASLGHFPQVAPRRRRGTLSREPLPPRGDEPAFLEGGDESLSSLPIVSVDGAPGDALG
jgi:hypothetical protein